MCDTLRHTNGTNQVSVPSVPIMTKTATPSTTATLATPTLFEQLGIRPLAVFANSRRDLSPQMRLEQVRRDALSFRETMLAGPQVRYFGSRDIVRAPYPSKYGFLNALKSRSDLLHLGNRSFVVQYDSPVGVKTLLLNPTHPDRNAQTPYYQRMERDIPSRLRGVARKLLRTMVRSVPDALADMGLSPDDIDFISYDHLHTQDIRPWFGTADEPGLFPQAKLLVMQKEWECTQNLLPSQADWYCPNGIAGLDPARVILLEGDVQLGDGIALMCSPGHTEGNHSLVVHSERGLQVCSENGIAADSYAPLASNIPGLRQYAQDTGMEVILNGNTLECTNDQYISMVQEKIVAGPHPDQPEFSNFMPTAELASYWAFPGIKPSLRFGEFSWGTLTSARTMKDAA